MAKQKPKTNDEIITKQTAECWKHLTRLSVGNALLVVKRLEKMVNAKMISKIKTPRRTGGNLPM